MATEVEALLHDVLVFMQQLLRLELPQLGETQLRGLVARLQQADTAFRPAYMDMKGTLQRPPRALADSSPPPPAARPESQVAVDDTDSADKWLWTSGDVGDLDTSADCSECQDGSLDDWPPRGAPSCPRPDLSPDYAVSAAAAKELAVRSGVVHRGGPGRWFRVGRRGWAALLPAPARLLVFAGPRSSRPRLVLPLVAPGGGGGGAAPCCDPCCAVYSARRRQGPAFELCCPGRKTHELWVSDDDEAQSWVDALRRASQDAAGPSPASPSTPISGADESLTASSVVAALGADDAKLHSGSRSRSQSRAGSAEATDCSAASQLPGLADQPPAPPLTPPPGPDDGQQQEYESMVSGGEEIYHDIAPPEKDAPSYANGVDYADGPSYANLASPASARASPERLQDDADLLARPLYDDVAARPQTPHYCNVAAEKAVEAENLYDDIGVGHSEGRASVYELIQDPVSQTHLGQSIRCS